MEKKKILYISQEISPFLPKSEISATARKLPQEIGRAVQIPRHDQILESVQYKCLNRCVPEQIVQTCEAQQCMVRIVHFKRAGCM